MKKILFIVFVVIFYLYVLDISKGQHIKPSCPIGFNSRLFHITLNGCTYDYIVCYKCEPHHYYITVSLNYWKKAYPYTCVPSPPLTDEQIKTAIENKIQIDDLTFLTNHCAIRPCDPFDTLGYTPITYIQYLCWQKKI